ncbi:MAG: hypothetical protein MUF84_12115 [Anaerolineae bacterium]|jgi:hypothetical protein|nr:hypothetical protein [Anaerolineae bacterium]
MAHLTGAIGYDQTSVVHVNSTTAPAPFALGTRARDTAGNEYIYLDFDAIKYAGELVTWDAAYLATDCGATTVGFIGVVVGDVSTSDKAGWVQIYGINTFVLAGSALTSGFLMVGATTDGLSVPVNQGTSGLGYAIHNMNAVTSASTATTPHSSDLEGTSAIGVFTARLNYPYVEQDIATS